MVADARHHYANAAAAKRMKAAKRKGPGGTMGSLGVLSWVTFFAQAKKVIKNPLTRPRCGRMGISKQKLLSSPTDSRAQRALVKEFMFISLRLAKKRTKERRYRNLRFLKAPPLGRRAGAAALA